LILGAFQSKPLKSETLAVTFSVGEGNVGFDLNNSVLTLGRSFPGGHVIRRFVNVSNDYDFEVKVNVLLSDNIVGPVIVDSGFSIEPNGDLLIPIELNIRREIKNKFSFQAWLKINLINCGTHSIRSCTNIVNQKNTQNHK